MKTRTDNELLTLIANDNELAFRELYDRYWYKMFAIANRKLRRREVAEEMAQELFVVIWQKRTTLRIINVQAFLSVSLKNLMIDYIRRHLQEEHYLDQLQQFFPTESFVTIEAVQLNELSEAVQRQLGQLPEKTRQIFILSRFEHLTIREIAQQLNLSEKTIEYHLTRSTAFLRTHLRDFATAWLVFLWI
ncbi:RNA polymerase sigma factor [Spirosoma daeguense]